MTSVDGESAMTTRNDEANLNDDVRVGDPIALGILLGVANTVVIAAAIAVTEPGRGGQTGACVFLGGFFPAIFTGAIVGRVAGWSARWSSWVRSLVLAAPALFVVWLLGAAFRFEHYIVQACVPTLAAAAALERRTRHRVVPVARATAIESRSLTGNNATP